MESKQVIIKNKLLQLSGMLKVFVASSFTPEKIIDAMLEHYQNKREEMAQKYKVPLIKDIGSTGMILHDNNRNHDGLRPATQRSTNFHESDEHMDSRIGIHQTNKDRSRSVSRRDDGQRSGSLPRVDSLYKNYERDVKLMQSFHESDKRSQSNERRAYNHFAENSMTEKAMERRFDLPLKNVTAEFKDPPTLRNLAPPPESKENFN